MNVEALKALAKDIETMADITWGLGGCDARKAFPLLWKTAMDAYCGSLDAAKALHDAVLPGWDLLISTYEDGLFEVSVSETLIVKTYDGICEIISRAWLLAIIRALIAQADKEEQE